MESHALIKIIDDYAEASGLKPSSICQYALQNRVFYDRLKNGGECLPRTAKRLQSWIASNPPSQPRSARSL